MVETLITADHQARITADKSGGHLYEDLTYKIRGALFEVYNTLGPGFKEDIYHRALVKEFKARKLSFSEQQRLTVRYKGEAVGVYVPDFIVDEKVIVEIKSLTALPSVCETQLYYYLKGSPYRLGLLVNFGANRLDIRRRIFDTAKAGMSPDISGDQRTYRRLSASRGQATLEMAIAMILSLGLLLGSIRLMLWFSERFIVRQKNYEASRVDAANTPGSPWAEPNTPLKLVDEE